MAKRQGAELTGLVVLDFPGINKSIGPVPLGGVPKYLIKVASTPILIG